MSLSLAFPTIEYEKDLSVQTRIISFSVIEIYQSYLPIFICLAPKSSISIFIPADISF